MFASLVQIFQVPVFLLIIILPQSSSATTYSKVEITKKGCGSIKSCYSDISTCSSIGDCKFLATYAIDNNDDLVISLSADDEYAAIGFGYNNRMPQTDAVACLRSGSDVVLQQFWITEYEDPRITSPTPAVIKLLFSSYKDGRVSCRFSRPRSPVNVRSMLNLSNPVYVVFAHGPVENRKVKVEVDYHSFTAFTLDKVDVTTPTNLNVVYGRNAGIKAHAILMSFAWIVCATVGVFLARYMRSAWPQHKLFGTKIWFQLHRALMFSTALLTIVAFITIFVTVGEFSKKATAHGVIGIFVLCAAIVQPIMATLRPTPGDAKRPLFNLLHRGAGVLGLTLAIINIFLGVCMPDMGMGNSGLSVMILYVALIILVLFFDVYLHRLRKNAYARFEVGKGDVEIQDTTAGLGDERPRLVMMCVVVVATAIVFFTLLGLSVSDDD